MDKVKGYVLSYFEERVVLTVLVMVLFMHCFVMQKTAFLNFLLPAGYRHFQPVIVSLFYEILAR